MPGTQESQPDWAPVFESNDAFAIGLAKGLLEDAGIPFWMEGDETAARLVLGPLVFPSCRFLVPREREPEARQLLEQLEPPQDESSVPASTGARAHRDLPLISCHLGTMLL